MLKKLVLLNIGLLMGYTVLYAQTSNTESYIQQYKDLAIREMKRTGVPAAIKLAQAILESQSGKSSLALTANNHFGIKCKTEWTGGKTYQDDDEKGECFRVYASAEQSFIDHSDFLKNRPYYAALFTLNPLDMEGWAYGLKKAGYATNSTYPQKILKIIKDYQLEQYNVEAVGQALTPEPIQTKPTYTAPATAINQPEIYNSDVVTYTSKSIFPKGIFIINRSKVVYAPAGASLQTLSQQFDVAPDDILSFNELGELDVLQSPSLLFLEKKSKKGNKAFRIAQAGDSWRLISQLEGIRLDQLLQYNQLTSENTPIRDGQKIWLQPAATNTLTSGTH
ncbi:MAG: hypothetical protein FGM61_08525 [Sediminibacterium sp.]|nr:hypothetical protein [Sediminibacterium sp.]